MLKDPYHFKSLKLVNNNSTLSNINRYIATDYMFIKEKEKLKIKPFSDIHLELNPVILYGLSDVERDIPSFSHPIINLENKWIALDLRNFIKVTSDGTSYEVKNESEYNLAIHRFILTGMWYVNKQHNIYGLKFPHFVFASWLSENLTRKFGLDLSAQLQLRVLGLIYYSHLFTDTFTSDDFDKLVIRGKDESIIPKLVEEINEKVTSLNNIDDFCKACYEVTGNIRLKGLDYSVLLNILNNNWYGDSAKELTILSLEHPPTWVSLVYASITQRSFRKTFISSIVEKMNKRGKGEDFVMSLSSLTNTQLEL